MKEIILNNKWHFKFGENNGDEQELNNLYDEIGLPHSFGIPYYGGDDFYIGYGCYQKSLFIPKEDLEKKLLLEFGAVFQVAEIFINGKFVKKHEGGYTAFVCDITDFVNEGANNLFVRVNNLWNAKIAPRAGEHLFNGGIYRDVKLLIYPKKHIEWYGTFVKSEKLSDGKAKIIIETETVNCSDLTLENIIFDAENNEVNRVKTIINSEITVQELLIENPNLWDVDSPYLYTVKTICGEDELYTSFGIRYIRWDKEKGFFLNEKHCLLDGANVHGDHGGWGDAVTHSGIKRDISMMKECGFNFIRGSHYPHHTEFAKECDRQGILFWSENVFWGIGGFKDEGYWDSSAMPTKKEDYLSFENSLKQSLREMIRTNRNSPSIICWSMGNEIFFSKKQVISDARKMVKRLVDYCHSIDDTRPAGIGGVQRGDFDKIGDVAGYNGDGAVLFKNPEKPNMVAEYGSIPAFRPGKYDLYETEGSDEYYDWRAGRCIWCGFHHGSIANIGNLGIVDLYRLPLRAWFAHREKLRGIAPPKFPKKGSANHLVLTADKESISCDGTDDVMLIAMLYDKNNNRISADIEITLEVVEGGGILPTGKKMIFNKDLKNCFDGACAIEMRAYYSGEIKVIASGNELISSEIIINAVGTEKYSGKDIEYPVAAYESINKNLQLKNIIIDRPVTVSSENVSGSKVCLTSENSNFKFWSPKKDEKTPYIILDLEHCYNRFTVKLKRIGYKKLEFKLYSSADRSTFDELSNTKFNYFQKANSLNFETTASTRYLKIEFLDNNQNIKIKTIEILG
ncbi:MAG: glycoside hydrolase family 2 TIM barrel-domain containing protein [Oscillospiraceae bacterium]